MGHYQKWATVFLLVLSLLVHSELRAQRVNLEKSALQPIGVSMSLGKEKGRGVVKVTKDANIRLVDEPTFVRVGEGNFQNGVIEVMVKSLLLPKHSPNSRGFIGVAFRISPNNDRFEAMYIRPTNGRATEQLRRNRATQYFSYPDYKFDRLRKEAPGEYESYADMGLNEWIKLRIEVRGKQAKLYVNGQSQPVLVVNDLKHGEKGAGGVGLWVDVDTEGYFRDLKIWHE